MFYRPDIDGLRAIAVCVVIFFHFNIAGFNGGFIGVDVFFVLSGFLIGSVIIQQLEKDSFSFVNFYFRRIRRLFPAFAVVMACTTLAAYLLMLPHDFREYGQSLAASTVYLSNLLFYWEAGYFDTASHLKPLLHTWSLSVEEQFYIIFPVLALIIYKCARSYMLATFLALTLLSLICAQWYLEIDSSAAFYLYPFRAWEMFIGVCLATGKLPNIKSHRLNSALAFLGLGLIVFASIRFSQEIQFPGINALIPCFGTCLIIYSGIIKAQLAHRWLSHPMLVFIGKISYSLYLWHWPVFVLYMYDKTKTTNFADIAFISAITFIASALTWKYIETPFRQGKFRLSRKSLSVFISTSTVSIAFIVIGYWFHKTDGLPSRFPDQTAQFAHAANDLFGDLSLCRGTDNRELPGVSYCPINNPFEADHYSLIWADSHGAAYKSGFEKANINLHSALLAWTAGCPPFFDIDKDESVSSQTIDAKCKKRNQKIAGLLQHDKRINSVVLVGRWSYYTNGGGIGVDQSNKIAVWPENQTPPPHRPNANINQREIVINAFMDTVKRLNNMGLQVFVVEQTPEFSQYKARAVALSLIKGRMGEELSNFTSERYEKVKKRQQSIQSAMEIAANKGLITIIKTHQYFCDKQDCSVLIDDIPAYFDNNHISATGAINISNMFAILMNFLDAKK